MKKESLLFGYVVGLMLVIGVGTAVGGYLGEKDRAAWEAFKAAHHCQAVSHEAGVPYKQVTYGPKNEVYAASAVSSSRTGWRCDDGVTRVVDDDGAPSSLE
jgi:hypothetical protein